MTFKTALFAAAFAAACATAGQALADDNPGLSKNLTISAIAFDRFNTEAGGLDGHFADGRQVANGVALGSRYDAKQFEKGMIAYAAFAAMREPTFVVGVRRAAEAAGSPAELARRLIADPRLALGFEGADLAQGRLRAALAGEVAPTRAAGVALKQAAYDVQHQAWSKSDVPGRDGRLALAKELSSQAGLGEVAETARLQTAVAGGGQMGLTAQSAEPPYTSEVVHSLAVAALAALGYADDHSLGQVMPILAEPNGAVCLNMAKLNLYQCLAVARPHYEDVFCLGQHALEDTGRCLMKGSGMAEPVDPRAVAAADAALQKASTTTKAKHSKKHSTN
jgi:hypothetical protein